eukprot:scaffold23151_cov117-Isochrysis_galbana.AAC.4
MMRTVCWQVAAAVWRLCVESKRESSVMGIFDSRAAPRRGDEFAVHRLRRDGNVSAVGRQCHSSVLLLHGECVHKGYFRIWLERPLDDAPSNGMHDLLVSQQKGTQLPRHTECVYKSSPALNRCCRSLHPGGAGGDSRLLRSGAPARRPSLRAAVKKNRSDGCVLRVLYCSASANLCRCAVETDDRRTSTSGGKDAPCTLYRNYAITEQRATLPPSFITRSLFPSCAVDEPGSSTKNAASAARSLVRAPASPPGKYKSPLVPSWLFDLCFALLCVYPLSVSALAFLWLAISKKRKPNTPTERAEALKTAIIATRTAEYLSLVVRPASPTNRRSQPPDIPLLLDPPSINAEVDQDTATALLELRDDLNLRNTARLQKLRHMVVTNLVERQVARPRRQTWRNILEKKGSEDSDGRATSPPVGQSGAPVHPHIGL